MALRQRLWAARAYAILVQELGGRCVRCGETDLEKLELDHIRPIEWEHEAREWSWRVSTYRREAREGKLQVLCKSCNLAKRVQDKEMRAADLPVEAIWNPV